MADIMIILPFSHGYFCQNMVIKVLNIKTNLLLSFNHRRTSKWKNKSLLKEIIVVVVVVALGHFVCYPAFALTQLNRLYMHCPNMHGGPGGI